MNIRSVACVTVASLFAGFAQAGHASASEAWSGVNLNIRSGPSVRFPPVGVIGAGTPMTIHGCLSRYTWCDVTASGIRGWASGAHLQIEHEARRVYVPAYAEAVHVPVVTFNFSGYWGDHYRDYSFYDERDRWSDHRWEDDGYRQGGALTGATNIDGGSSSGRRESAPACQLLEGVSRPATARTIGSAMSARNLDATFALSQRN